MLFGFVLVVHVLVAVFLIAVILLQGGRGGMGEALGGAAAQSLFGGGANVVMTRVTAGAAILFVVTCLSLAGLSTVKGRSVIDQLPGMPQGPAMPAATEPGPAAQAPAPAAPAAQPETAGEGPAASPAHDSAPQ